jgi:hypothetical protein
MFFEKLKPGSKILVGVRWLGWLGLPFQSGIPQPEEIVELFSLGLITLRRVLAGGRNNSNPLLELLLGRWIIIYK